MTDNEHIRQSIREELTRMGWSQDQLATKLGISKSSLSQLLSGRYGKVPQSLLDVLDALDLELQVVPRKK